MERSNTTILRKIKFVLLTALVTAILSSCDGDQGPSGAAGVSTNTTTVSYATSLAIKIDGVTINSAPVVNFSVSNQDGTALAGLTTSDLRFTIAKLTPGVLGASSVWQNYINRESDGAIQGSQERDRSGYPLGTLVDNDDGTYIYTFKTNLDEAAANCPAPCEDADGNPLDVSYNPALTHRVVIQLSHSTADFPPMNAVYTFRPSDGETNPMNLFTRDIVKTENCNECHNQLSVHGSRVEVQYCVMCHNPGSWDGENGNTADFKVMIHKIHMGEELPSVIAAIPYEIGGHDYSDVVFPQDIRNCTKCHDGSDPLNNPRATSEGNNWETQVTMEACGSCHDNIKFDVAGPPIPGATDPDGHPGGVMVDNSLCTVCHSESGPVAVGSIADRHTNPATLAATRFQFKIIDVTGGATPSIQISVTDPTNSDTPYDLTTDEFIGGGARLALIIGWGLTDFNNTGGVTQTGFPTDKPTAAIPLSIDPVAACGAGIADWVCSADTPSAGIYTLTKSTTLPGTATDTGRVGFEGHVAADFDGDLTFGDQVAIKSVVKDFVITGTLTPRREVVDIAKCDNCHEFLSLHGGNRNDEPALCVICHNPNATDIGRRPLITDTPVLPTTDGKVEEAIDFKTLIHGIHAGAETNYDLSEAHGFREKGLVVWGFPGAPCNGFGGPANDSCEHDFSHVRFPGILQDCETCHKPGTYELDGDYWASPTANDILSTTVTTAVNTDPDDDDNISPTAAVCSSCHDGDVARAHMINLGGAAFAGTQGTISSTIIETCSVCHGPGDIADVEAVHAGR